MTTSTTSLALHENVGMYLDSAIRTSSYGSMENLAHYLYIEMPDFHKKAPKALAKATGIPEKAWRALKVDVRWRRIVSQLQTLDIVDYTQERADIETIHDLIYSAEKDADKLRAFDTMQRQMGTKVPERQEVEQTQRVEIVTRQLPDNESGYQPHTPYSPPVSRRQALGQLSRPEENKPGVAPAAGEIEVQGVTVAKRPAGLGGTAGSHGVLDGQAARAVAATGGDSQESG